ncbi:TolC family protein [Sphingobacterium sp. lm-10]|uniref:TolC family protein n=1 Tax=Sphingobacterium sp. lm-10 TaxID=2944904 RepID=UPI002021404D|nr:TolC family protein [Sphingobacterium sp. lm-10]MCL7986852.1 TolC family protein [Sphingobacterium sp. lm-10]
MKKHVLAGLLICSLSFPSVYAQIRISSTLESAIESAINHSSNIKNHSLEHRKAEDEQKAVMNKYLPTLSANATYVYLNNDLKLDVPTATLPISGANIFEGTSTINTSANVFAAGLTAKQVLFSGGQIANGAKALAAKNEGNLLIDEIQKDELVKDVIGSFDQIRLLAQAEVLLQESEVRLQKEKERVEKAVQNGLAIPYDRDKIKLASLNLDAKKSEIQGKKQLLYIKLNNLTGFERIEIDSVTYELDPIKVSTELDILERNELKAMKAFSQALDYNLKKEKGSLLPTVGAFASYSYASLFNVNSSFALPIIGSQAHLSLNQATLSPNWMLGGVLKWEIFGGFERKHRIEAVKIDQQILANKQEDSQRMMNLQLQNNLVNYRVLLNQLSIAEQQEKIARDNLTTAEKQYKLGLINVTERISAETDVYEMALNKIQILINQRQAALNAYGASKPLYHFIQVQ